MTNTLIIGANGSIARLVEQKLLKDGNQHLTLYLRDANRLADLKDNPNVTLVDGDAMDVDKLKEAMKGIDIVFVALGATHSVGLTKGIITAMKADSVKRIIEINDGGIYDEIPGAFGEYNKSLVGNGLKIGKESDQLLKKSGLDYTTLRLSYLDNKFTDDYLITAEGTPFKGTSVSREAVATLVTSIIEKPNSYSNESIGVSEPGTDGDTPQF